MFFFLYEMVSPLNLMHKQINSPGKPVRQAIKRQRERGREPFLKPRASESVRIKQLPKGKRARRLKKKERTANLTGAQERRGNRESGEARSDLGTRFAAIRREIKQNPTNSNRGSEMYRNLRETRIHLSVGAQRSGSDQSKQNSDRSGPKQGGGKNPNTAAPHSGAPKHETQPQNRIIRQNPPELARRAYLAGVDARPPPIALGSPPRRCSSAAGPAEIPRPLRNYSPLPCLWGAPSSSS